MQEGLLFAVVEAEAPLTLLLNQVHHLGLQSEDLAPMELQHPILAAAAVAAEEVPERRSQKVSPEMAGMGVHTEVEAEAAKEAQAAAPAFAAVEVPVVLGLVEVARDRKTLL